MASTNLSKTADEIAGESFSLLVDEWLMYQTQNNLCFVLSMLIANRIATKSLLGYIHNLESTTAQSITRKL